MDEIKPKEDTELILKSHQSKKENNLQTIVSAINEIDPDKLTKVVEAVVAPFHKASKQMRREIIIGVGTIMIIIIGVLSALTFMNYIEPAYLIFFLTTVFGYIMGFVTRFFIHDK
ncbi:MAG: hypothetical protein WC562_09555 [Dehalococcoidia bacterium]